MQHRDTAIEVRGLSKSYRISRTNPRHTTLGEAAIHWLRNPLRHDTMQTFHALEDVSFEVDRGEVVGIVGRNGAGKSTLLKILSRITEPTAGEIDLYGRVGSLLEVGTGFHPELTGRENVFLNGSILGMRRREIQRQFDAIVEFAGIGLFLDTPVKRYSSGMYVRLAFAVAAHLNPEILVVDEVLAVGDSEFQQKCLGKMKDVARSGRTVLLVSHQMQSVQVLCTKALYLEAGRATYFGDVAGAIQRYTKNVSSSSGELPEAETRPGSGEYRLTHVTPNKAVFTADEPKTVGFHVRKLGAAPGRVYVACALYTAEGICVAQCDSRLVDQWLESADEYTGEFVLSHPWLRPGRYSLTFAVCGAQILDFVEQACWFTVAELLPYGTAVGPDAVQNGVVFADFRYSLAEGAAARDPRAAAFSAGGVG